MVVITGGEPLMWNMDPLTELLKENNLTFLSKISNSERSINNEKTLYLK